eukprot:jgi/Orpsp1_1/1185298/evm.model.c7180000093125.1
MDKLKYISIKNDDAIFKNKFKSKIKLIIIPFLLIVGVIFYNYSYLFKVFPKNNRKIHYDYLIVGSGLYGATFNYLAKQAGKTTIVIEKRDVIGGNLYCENIEGIFVHKYGPHIFHTDNLKVWNF